MKAMMRKINYIFYAIVLFVVSCKVPSITQRKSEMPVPSSYNGSVDSTNIANISWREFYKDTFLTNLIDTALSNNKELQIQFQQIQMMRNEVLSRSGEYRPFVKGGGDLGLEKVGRYTSQGANDANTEIAPGKEFPDPLGNIELAANLSWEVDIWHKLRNAQASAQQEFLASQEGQNFMKTQVVGEIAASYYELLALDRQLVIIDQNIAIQTNALDVVRQQKEAGRTTELAVKKFEAEVYHSQSLRYAVAQEIVAHENRINLLMGRYPQHIARNDSSFALVDSTIISQGIPSQLLTNRPDIRKAEYEMQATRLNVQVARAAFLPSLDITAAIGLNAFNPAYLINPESILYNLAGGIVGPVLNKRAIQAEFNTANAKQLQSIYDYELKILQAYSEVNQQLNRFENLTSQYGKLKQQVDALNQSIEIASQLFRYARADYMEVLLTQRDALEAKLEAVEVKKMQMVSMVDLYKALGGGWK